MRRDIFFMILIVLGFLTLLADVAFGIYVGVVVAQIKAGLIFLPAIFNTLCLSAIIVNGVVAFYTLLYLIVLRRN